MSGWYHINVYNYILLRERTSLETFEEKIKDHVGRVWERFFPGYDMEQDSRKRPE